MFGLDIFLKGVQNILSLDQTVFDEHWIFESVSRLGVPEVTSVAYDESQGYLALGCKSGRAILIGNGWEQWLDSCPSGIENSPIVQLLFRRGDSLLYGINQVGQIMTWSLTDFKCLSMSFPDPILKIDLNPCSPWLVIAFESGLVKLMDCLSTRMSKYLIPIDIRNGQKLKSMQLNPLDFNLILLGYENDCVLWNFEEKRVSERFALSSTFSSKGSLEASATAAPSSLTILTDVCWDPNGVEFATSYNNGQIVVWSTKKTMLQGLGLKKKKHIHIYNTGSPVEKMQWIEATSSSSLLFVSHTAHPKITRLEITKEKFDKATGVIQSCKDVVSSFTIFKVHHSCLLITITRDGIFEVHQPRVVMPIEIPTSLFNLISGPHQACTVCDDGFLLINSIKQTRHKKPTMLLGGSLHPKNTIRNYHILVTLRRGSLEFWHMSIPFPSFLCSVSVNHIEDLGASPDFSDLSLYLDVKERVLIIQTPSKLVICDFIQQNVDIDDMMDELDTTMAALEKDRSVIRTMSRKDPSPVEDKVEQLVYDAGPVFDQHKQADASLDHEQVVVDLATGTSSAFNPPEMNDAAVWAHDSPSASRITTPLPSDQPVTEKDESRKDGVNFFPHPEVIPRTTSLKDISSIDVKCTKTPPLFIADAQWTTSVAIDFPRSHVIASYAYSSHSKCALLATKDDFFLVGLNDCRVVYQKQIVEFVNASASLQTLPSTPHITHVHFCMLNEHRSFLVLTTQSIILFRLSVDKLQPLSAMPLFASHCEEEFGIVLYVNGLNRDFKLCTQEYESWCWIVVITTSSVLVFQVSSASSGDGNASLELMNRRDFDAAIVNGGIVHIQDNSHIVLVCEEEIMVLGMSTLNVCFKKSLMDIYIPVSKSHLSQAYICPTGFVGLWLKTNQWHLFQINNNVPIASIETKVYDTTKAKRYAEEKGIAVGAGKRNEAADLLFSPVQPAKNLSKEDQISSEATGLAGDLARVGHALAERGEKLDELADRSGELANASSSFANSMKQIRQAQEKRWF